MRLTSSRNPIVQRLRRLSGRRSARHDEGCFVIEGPVLLEEALNAGLAVELVLASEEHPVVRRARSAGIEVVMATEQVVAAAASTTTPQPVVAVARRCDAPADVLDRAGFVVVAAGLADPGNVGTVVRTAHAAGADAVVLTSGSADVFAPKVVRAAAGSLFHVPVVVDVDVLAVLERLGTVGVRRLGAVARGGTPCDEIDLVGPVALVLGGEAHGLPAEAEASLDGLVSIPMPGPAESLNVAVAAGVLCFEVVRQRRPRGPVPTPR